MVAPSMLLPGRVYRTRELWDFSSNPTRWAKRLVEKGELREAAHGLYYRPQQTFFGPCAPSDEELLRAFLGSDHFRITGSSFWNALNLGTTQHLAYTLVYNDQRTGDFRLDHRPFRLRRVRFPTPATKEWFTVDLLNNEESLGEDPRLVEKMMQRAVEGGRLNAGQLLELGKVYGSVSTRQRLERMLSGKIA